MAPKVIANACFFKCSDWRDRKPRLTVADEQFLPGQEEFADVAKRARLMLADTCTMDQNKDIHFKPYKV